MQTEIEPTEPQAPESLDKAEALDQKSFNQSARDAAEAEFEAFQAAEEPPSAETAPQEPADKPFVPEAEITREDQTPEETKRTSFKTMEEADRAYLEARRKMTEATERAAKLERERQEAEFRANEALNLAIKIAGDRESVSRTTTEPRGEARPAVTKEELEAQFYEDPVGFLISVTQSANQDAIRESERRIEAAKNAAAADALTNATQRYFDENHSDIKDLEVLVTNEIGVIMRDAETRGKILSPRKSIGQNSMALVDEAARRIRDKIPAIISKVGGSTTTKKRLVSGAPPVVPGGSTSFGPRIVQTATRSGETNEEYIEGRLKRQERMQVGSWTR